MKDWFDNLEAREQLFVGTGAIVVALIVLWGLVWLPLANGHRDVRQSVADWQQSLAELRAIGATVQSGGSDVAVRRVASN